MTLTLLLVAGNALAHIPLTPEILQDAFVEIQGAQARADAATDTAEKAAAVYNIAVGATEFMTLLNQEVQLHGLGQQSLLNDAVARAAQLGVDITWSPDHERYFYSGAAYEQYLELVPDGIEAANSQYQLIETGFYLGDSENREELVARAARESEFLKRYPDFGSAERVAMFLAIDYRDLWRLCRAADDRDCSERYAALNREHLVAVADRYKDAKTGELARTLLGRFEAEIDEQQ
jgi:hypothetical protein